MKCINKISIFYILIFMIYNMPCAHSLNHKNNSLFCTGTYTSESTVTIASAESLNIRKIQPIWPDRPNYPWYKVGIGAGGSGNAIADKHNAFHADKNPDPQDYRFTLVRAEPLIIIFGLILIIILMNVIKLKNLNIQLYNRIAENSFDYECSNCSAPLKESYRYCPDCGVELEADTFIGHNGREESTE